MPGTMDHRATDSGERTTGYRPMKTLFTTHLKGDRTIWMVALILGVVSLLAVYSACSWMAWRHDGGTLRVLFKHGLMLAAGGFIARSRYG